MGTAYRQHGHFTLDVRDPAAIRNFFHVHQPEIVFLPAAMTHVDRAELHPEECRAINVAGTIAVARSVRQFGGRLVLFSTDHVFAECARPMVETRPLKPLSVYAKSKAEAEEHVRDLLPDAHLILRTSWVFGPEDQGKNFVYRAVRTLRAGEPLVIAADQFGQPTYGPDLARVALDLARAHHNGTFHVIGPLRMTRSSTPG